MHAWRPRARCTRPRKPGVSQPEKNRTPAALADNLESRQMEKFEPGRTYFGTLSCAHSRNRDIATCAAKPTYGMVTKPRFFTDGMYQPTKPLGAILTLLPYKPGAYTMENTPIGAVDVLFAVLFGVALGALIALGL
jgi:hypothetical protein